MSQKDTNRISCVKCKNNDNYIFDSITFSSFKTFAGGRARKSGDEMSDFVVFGALFGAFKISSIAIMTLELKSFKRC